MSAISWMWQTAGQPSPNWQGKAKRPITAPDPRPGVCALTGTNGPVWPVGKVSTTLTIFDRLPYRDRDPKGLALGPVGAWAFRHRIAMQQPHAIVNSTHQEVTCGDLYNALVSLANDPTALVSVPISRQKHVIPWAEWGCVGVDDEWIPWGAQDLDRLSTYRTLRQLGFSEPAFLEPAPRWVVLRKLDTAAKSWVLHHWPVLDPWRQHPSLLEVAARATRTPKETK